MLSPVSTAIFHLESLVQKAESIAEASATLMSANPRNSTAALKPPRGTKYFDDWMENDWRVEGLLDIIDLEDHDAYGAAHNQVVEHRIATIDALLSHQKTHVNIQDIEGASALHRIRYEERVCALIVSKLVKKGADV
jgi:hypothetical protein